jgi:hypothetical protein
VVNVTDPQKPLIAGSCIEGLYAEGVFVSGDYVYMGNYFGGLQVITFK